jgi:hypothetical protein
MARAERKEWELVDTPGQVLEVLTHPEEIRRVEIHAADEASLELSAQGPVALDVRYELMRDEAGAELEVSMRRGEGLTGGLVAKATAALLSGGALEGAAGRIARVAESGSSVAAA